MSGKSAVYGTFCKTTGKAYIGSSNRVEHRKWVHFNSLNTGIHHSIKLQRSWNKHTPTEYVFSVLEFCPDALLIEREQFYIDAWNAYDDGYNGRPIAESSRGSKRSPEAIAKFKATIQARYGGSPKRGMRLSDNTKHLIRIARAKQAPASLECRAAASLRMRGNKFRQGAKQSDAWRNHMSQIMKGRHTSPDTELKPGHIKRPETIAKISTALKGKPLSNEHRKKLSESHKGLPANNIKTYSFISPSGEVINITNLKRFCMKYGLSASHMNSVYYGKRNIHKGWRKDDRQRSS